MVDNTITKVSIQTTNQYGGIRFWELKCERKDSNFNRFNVTLGVMQTKGIAKTLNSTRKVENWLNTEEGLAWLNKSKQDYTRTAVGNFVI